MNAADSLYRAEGDFDRAEEYFHRAIETPLIIYTLITTCVCYIVRLTGTKKPPITHA